MRPALDWESIVGQVRERLRETGDDEALVSLVLAPPASVVLRDLRSNFAYLDLRSGLGWDCFFAGYGADRWGRFEGRGEFRAEDFRRLVKQVAYRYEKAVAERWRYSGKCDVVSWMVYRGARTKAVFDWHSMRAVTLTDANDRYAGQSLGEMVEVLSDWRDEEPGLAAFAPGEAPGGVGVGALGGLLASALRTGASGVTVNAAYDLLKKLAE
jgi:hypothetical protein